MGWVTPQHPTKAELDACVQCGLCLPHCPTFRLTGDEAASPRGRLAAMALVAAGEAEVDSVFEEVMGFCLQCRACEAVCPSLVPFGRAMEGARAEVAAQRPSATGRLRRLVLGRALASRLVVAGATTVAALAQRLRVASISLPGTRRLSGLRRVPLLPRSRVGHTWRPRGEPIGTAALLVGCVMDPWFGEVHEATARVLTRAGYLVVAPTGQTCCGALAAHDGAVLAAQRLAARNVAAFRGFDLVVANAAGCGAHLADYAHWAPGGGAVAGAVRDVTEVVAELIDEGRLPEVPGRYEPVAVQDPCHLRHAQRVVGAPRRVVRAAGWHPVEIDVDGLCCGAAGVYSLTYPDTSAELGQQKAAQVRASGAAIVVSANPGCELQLRTYLGDDVEIVHPVELYARALAGAASPSMTRG